VLFNCLWAVLVVTIEFGDEWIIIHVGLVYCTAFIYDTYIVELGIRMNRSKSLLVSIVIFQSKLIARWRVAQRNDDIKPCRKSLTIFP
jgi:hypothetical protein